MMKCLICKKMIRQKNKHQLCSNCQISTLGQLVNKGLVDLKIFKKGVKDEINN